MYVVLITCKLQNLIIWTFVLVEHMLKLTEKSVIWIRLIKLSHCTNCVYMHLETNWSRRWIQDCNWLRKKCSHFVVFYWYLGHFKNRGFGSCNAIQIYQRRLLSDIACLVHPCFINFVESIRIRQFRLTKKWNRSFH